MTWSTKRSAALFERANQLFPGGVNSPVRAFKSVGGTPLFIDRAEGAYVWDADGNRYIDYMGSWGPAIVGHAHPEVVAAITTAASRGLSFGAPSAGENKLAEKIQSHMPSLERMRFVSSGTEACMSALRLARAFTGRMGVLKFTGCYHGHADMLLVQAGSGVMTLGLPDSPGVPKGATQETYVAPFNDLAAVEKIFAERGSEMAAIILEPIIGNSGFIRPADGFLEGLAEITKRHGALLIFDEVMTGFRVGMGGVQGLKKMKPDLTTLAKVVGGGMPIGVYGGRADIMAQVAPAGPMYQAGTLSGNPVAMACGLKTLEILEAPGAFGQLASRIQKLVNGFRELASDQKIPFNADGEGGMFGFFFRAEAVRRHEDAKEADLGRFQKFFGAMLRRGIYLAPSAFEAGFVSLAHTDADIDQTLAAAREAFSEIA